MFAKNMPMSNEQRHLTENSFSRNYLKRAREIDIFETKSYSGEISMHGQGNGAICAVANILWAKVDFE